MLNRLKPNFSTREAFLDLPLLNRWLLGSGTAMLVAGVLLQVGPPVASGVSAAVHPYTAAGKEERCLENLRLIGQELEKYREGHDGHYPLVEEPTKGGSLGRSTWVSALRGGILPTRFQCPAAGGGDGIITGGYGLNAALAGVRQNDIPNPERVIVLAERGEAHDLALLPPLEGWQPAGSSDSGQSDPTKASNVAPAHGGKVGVLFADGRAAMLEPGPWLRDLQSWGGSLAVRQARERLLQAYPMLEKMQETADKEGGKEAVNIMRQQAAQDELKKADTFKGSMQAAHALWVQNDEASFDADTDSWGWELAKLADRAGHPEWLGLFDKEQSRRSAALLQEARESANDNSWQSQEGAGFKISVPAGWQREDEQESRYRRTYFRSASPHISVLVEWGQRTSPGPEAGIDWAGMEAGLKEKYGKRYKRLSMGETVLAGETASLWEFEIDRKDAPKLRKLYVGRSRTWDSLVFTAMAPARDFDSWRPVFIQMKDGLERR